MPSGLFLLGHRLNGHGTRAALEAPRRLVGGWRRLAGRRPHSELCERVVEQTGKFLEGRMGHGDPDNLYILNRALAELSRRCRKGKQDDSRPLANMSAGDEDRRIHWHLIHTRFCWNLTARTVRRFPWLAGISRIYP